jgi:hypothetical protein
MNTAGSRLGSGEIWQKLTLNRGAPRTNGTQDEYQLAVLSYDSIELNGLIQLPKALWRNGLSD